MMASRFDDGGEWAPVDARAWCFTALFPCVVLGRVTTALRREPSGPCGLGREGAKACVGAACCPFCLPCMSFAQRAELMRVYGIRGGRANGLVFPTALAQHDRFVARAELRWPWESSAAWDVKARPSSPSFDVVVLGGRKAGTSSLVRALVGGGCGEEIVDRQPGTFFGLATRLVAHEGVIIVLRFWDIQSDPDLDLPDIPGTAAALVVFNADSRDSLDDALDRYRRKFPANRPPVRHLVGNIHCARAVDDTCEFLDDVHAAARDHDMDIAMLSANAPSIQGTKRLLDTLVARLLLEVLHGRHTPR